MTMMAKRIDGSSRTSGQTGSDRTLRRVLVAAGASAGDKPILDGSLRAGLETLLRDAGPGTPQVGGDDAISDVALAVVASDDDLKGLIERAEHGAPPKDFGVDPIQLLNSASLALIVLSLYLDIERDKNGRVSVKFGIKPVSDKVKSKLLDLIGSVARSLPKK
jgi:hypothetical protein